MTIREYIHHGIIVIEDNIDREYLVNGVLIDEVAPPITGTLATVNADDTLAASGIVSGAVGGRRRSGWVQPRFARRKFNTEPAVMPNYP